MKKYQCDINHTFEFQVTGHRNIQSLNEYRTLTVQQQKEISTILSNSVSSKSTAVPAHPSSPISLAQPDVNQPQVATIPNQLAQPSQPDGSMLFDESVSDVELMNSWEPKEENMNTKIFQPCNFYPTNCTFNGTVIIKMN